MTDGVILEWKDPPEGTSYPQIVGALKQRPGSWAFVFSVPTREQAKARAQSIRRAGQRIEIPCETAVRRSPWGEREAFHVYARALGV